MQPTAAARAVVHIAPLTGDALAGPGATHEGAADRRNWGHGRCRAPRARPRPFPPGELLTPLAPDHPSGRLISHRDTSQNLEFKPSPSIGESPRQAAQHPHVRAHRNAQQSLRAPRRSLEGPQQLPGVC